MRPFAATILLTTALFAQLPAPPAKTGSITGIVIDTDGKPAEGIKIVAEQLDFDRTKISWIGGAGATTGESGSYSLALPPGEYRVTVAAVVPAVIKIVKVEADQKVKLDLVVASAPAISGRVLNQDKEPVLDAFVWLIRSEYAKGVAGQDVIGPSVTGEDGSYRFEKGLEPNRRYYLLAERPPSEEIVTSDPAAERTPIDVSTYYPSSSSFDAASAIVLRPGERRTQVDIKVATAPYYCVDGKIRSSGVPASIWFSVFEGGVSAPQLARLQSVSLVEGKYRVCGLTRGSYRLSADGASVDFAIGSSDVHGVDLSADPARVSVVVEREQRPAPDPKLTPEDISVLRTLAGLLGQPAGTEEQVLRFAAGAMLSGGRRDATVDRRLDVIIARGELDLEAARKASFKIALAKPSWSIAIALGEETAQISAEKPAPIEKQLQPGEYYVAATYSDSVDSYIKEVSYNGTRLPDRMLRLAPGSNGTLRVSMGKDGGTVNASVTESEGKPLANVTVLLIAGSPVSPAALSRGLRVKQTDASGIATFQGVAPGAYKVLSTSQTLRPNVPEDLERILLVMFHSQDVQVDAKATVPVKLRPVDF